MDTDIDLGFEDEEEERPLEEDELARYLEDDVEEDSDEGKKRAQEEEEARLQAIVDRKIADRFVNQPVVKEEPKQKPEYRDPTPAAPQDVDKLLDQMAEELTNDLANGDSKTAFKKMLQASRALANEGKESATARTNRILVENYRAARKDDPLFKAIEDEFDKRVDSYTEEQLGKATPAQVRAALQEVEDAAIGRYYRDQRGKKVNKTGANPPSYGGSTGGGGQRTAALTPAQRALVKMGKSAGLSDKDIKELVRAEKG